MLAILLAAGSGRRLGGPKALLDLGGRTALQRCLDALRQGGVEALRVVLGARADEVRARVDLAGAEVVVNPQPDRGQTSSLRAGLAGGCGGHDAFLLHPVDHPLLRPEQVSALRAAWDRRGGDVRIVVPSVAGRRGHPALFDATLAEEFLALDDDEPAHRVVRRDAGRVHHVVMDDEWLVRDVDDADDLGAARAALAHRTG